jgi:NAD(P)-dependent dehydrogenase (short-subunit alcohol dehydrogenase family)
MTDKPGGAMRLQSKVTIVTGGAMGIGKGIAGEFVKEGATAVIADVDEQAGLIEAVVAEHGRLDVVVNNAAIGVYQSVTDATTEDFDRCLAVNLRGPFLGIKHAVAPMRAAGGGSIINIASVHSVQNVGGTAPYAASKGGVAALTRAAAIDLAADNIRVNAICPGWIHTPLIQGIFDSAPDPDAMRRDVERRQLLKRLGTPEEVGRAAVFLASDDSSYVTGSLLFVDNGMTAQLETWAE